MQEDLSFLQPTYNWEFSNRRDISAFIYCLLSWLIKHNFLLTNFYSSDFRFSVRH